MFPVQRFWAEFCSGFVHLGSRHSRSTDSLLWLIRSGEGSSKGNRIRFWCSKKRLLISIVCQNPVKIQFQPFWVLCRGQGTDLSSLFKGRGSIQFLVLFFYKKRRKNLEKYFFKLCFRVILGHLWSSGTLRNVSKGFIRGPHTPYTTNLLDFGQFFALLLDS